MSLRTAPEGDDELAAQLAHLDALEHRAADRRTRDGARLRRAVPGLSGGARGRRDLPAAPGAAGAGGWAGALLDWYELACEVLAERVGNGAAELDRLRAQWDHVLRNLDRLRPEEVAAVAENLAALRESLAADAAVHDALRAEHDRLAGVEAALDSPLADPALVLRLLDDVTRERALGARLVGEAAAELVDEVRAGLAGLEPALASEPARAPGAVEALSGRLDRAAARLRERQLVCDPDEDEEDAAESLEEALRRICDRCAGAVPTELRWLGGEMRTPEMATAVAWVVRECLFELSSAPGSSCAVEAGAPPGERPRLRLRWSSPSLPLDCQHGWLARARARAGLCGGLLVYSPAPDGGEVELRFPA